MDIEDITKLYQDHLTTLMEKHVEQMQENMDLYIKQMQEHVDEHNKVLAELIKINIKEK